MSLYFEPNFRAGEESPESGQPGGLAVAQPLQNVMQDFIQLIGGLGGDGVCFYRHLADNAFHTGPMVANGTAKPDGRYAWSSTYLPGTR